MSIDNTIFADNSDLQYLITFDHDYYNKLIIDHKLIVTDEIANKELEHENKLEANTNRGVNKSIGACGTICINLAEFSKELKINKEILLD
ncbi:10169_t:CDS:2 [Cetraspora pellucida]|uniref:10169_t:CDS:1 n=1 Tax=Cetraspora pellucida TaxID=1433469 RepID=A0A9N9IU94_9GLOM|nr:10169_t:CDS:2 [Cetraspora pellucida]